LIIKKKIICQNTNVYDEKHADSHIHDEIETYTMITIMALTRKYDKDGFKVIIISDVVFFFYISVRFSFAMYVLSHSSHIIFVFLFFFFSLVYQRNI